jgi:hypothetical protein
LFDATAVGVDAANGAASEGAATAAPAVPTPKARAAAVDATSATERVRTCLWKLM